jgi:hypothetical protein
MPGNRVQPQDEKRERILLATQRLPGGDEMNKKKYCVYDNPSTMCREAYIDGRKIAFITAELVGMSFDPNPLSEMRGMQRWGDWETGKLQGDKDAILNSNNASALPEA